MTPSVHLVGACNNDKFLQTYLGRFTILQGKPVITNIYEGRTTTSLCEVTGIRGDRYEFKEWLISEGLTIWKEDTGWQFVTGTNDVRGSGMRGTLINGGAEMTFLLDNLLY